MNVPAIASLTDFVVDTSVFVKLFRAESDSDIAEALFERHGTCRIIVPGILVSELANVLWVHVQSGKLSEAEANELPRSGLTVLQSVTIVPFSQIAFATLFVALKLKHAVYDAAFLA